MPPLILGVILFTGLSLLSAALGLRIFSLLKLRVDSRLERIVLGTALGLGLLQFVPFTLFALGIGKPAYFRLAVVCLSLILIPDLLRIARGFPRAFAETRRLPAWQQIMLGVFGFLFAAIFLRSLCPITDDD